MNTKIVALAAILATTLVFANNAYADSNLDKHMVSMLEKKQAKESKVLIKVLEEYKKSLNSQDLTSKVMEKRVNESNKFIESKIDGIVSLLKNGKTTTSQDTLKPKLDIIQVEKVRTGTPGSTDVIRLTYRVTAGDSAIQNAKVVIDTKNGSVINTISGLLPLKSATYTLFVKGIDPNNLLVKLG